MGFKNILQTDFNQLHPKIQERYEHVFTKPFQGTGTMQVMMTEPFFLKPVYKNLAKYNFIIPESGENIPFRIRTTPFTVSSNMLAVKWERSFYFPKFTRRFDTTLYYSLEEEQAVDYLGSPALVSAQMHYRVTKAGQLVHLSGLQQAHLGPLRLTLPRFLSGHGAVIDGYDDKRNLHTVQALIANDIVGNLMIYSGKFQEEI